MKSGFWGTCRAIDGDVWDAWGKCRHQPSESQCEETGGGKRLHFKPLRPLEFCTFLNSTLLAGLGVGLCEIIPKLF